MRKPSNPEQAVPVHAATADVDYETGEMAGTRSRTDFSGSSARRLARDHELGAGGDRRRGVAEMQSGWAARCGLEVSTRSNPTRSVPHRIAGENGSLPASGLAPKPPPVLVLYVDLVDA